MRGSWGKSNSSRRSGSGVISSIPMSARTVRDGPPHVVVLPHEVRNQQRVGPVYGRPGRLVTAQPYGLPRVENPGAVPLQERGGQADLAGRLIIVTMR